MALTFLETLQYLSTVGYLILPRFCLHIIDSHNVMNLLVNEQLVPFSLLSLIPNRFLVSKEISYTVFAFFEILKGMGDLSGWSSDRRRTDGGGMG